MSDADAVWDDAKPGSLDEDARTCTYCVRNDTTLIDEDGDAICSDCALPADAQGEPSDAQVLAALNAEDNMRAVQGGYKPRAEPELLSEWKAHDIERMRSVVGAALRAAGKVGT